MAEKLPTWTFLVIGVAVTVISYILDRSSEKPKMALFLVIGLLFIAIGVAKLLIAYIMSPERKKPKVQKKASHRHEIRCPSCHAKLHPRFRFCPGCGTRVRR